MKITCDLVLDVLRLRQEPQGRAAVGPPPTHLFLRRTLVKYRLSNKEDVDDALEPERMLRRIALDRSRSIGRTLHENLVVAWRDEVVVVDHSVSANVKNSFQGYCLGIE